MAINDIAINDDAIRQSGAFYRLDLAFPRTGHAAIDAVIVAFVEERRDAVLPYMTDPVAAQYLPEGSQMFAELTYAVTRNDGEWLTVAFDYMTYDGGAHPNSMQYGMNFLVEDGAVVELVEIVGNDGIAEISRIAIAELTAALGGPDGMSDINWISRGAGARESNFAVFQFLPRELVIIFPEYQVAAYAAGPQSVSIPMTKLARFVRADVRAPMASFDCGKAATAVEKGICGDAGVARLDRQVADFYRGLLMYAFEAAETARVKQAQRDFLAARDDACGGKAAGAAMTQCLIQAYEARMQAMINP